MRRYAKLLLIFISVIFCNNLWSQSVYTPYSRYGYGLLNDNSTSAQRAMGGVGYAMNSGRQINVKNPASYANIDSLTFLFDMGVDINQLWTSEGDTKGKKLGGGLDYVTLQVPLTKWGGASIGFLPYSSVNYAFGEKIENGSAIYSGSGGISQLYLGLAAKPVEGFTVGVNISYLFGNITHDNYSYTSSTSSSIGLFERVISVKDYMIEIGAQYTRQIDRRNRLTLGVMFSPGKSFHGNSYGIQYDAQINSEPDTIGYTSLKGKYTQPFTLGAGVNWQWNDRLMVEVDATYQPWSKAKYASIDGLETSRFVNRYKGAVGAQYCINPRGSFSDRIQYRAGFSATRDYWLIMGNSIRQYGVSMGVGLPVPGSKTMINLSVEYQTRHAVPNPLVKEKYLFLTLGVNFNEIWFWQNKLR